MDTTVVKKERTIWAFANNFVIDAFKNPVKSFPCEIDGDMRFSKEYMEEHLSEGLTRELSILGDSGGLYGTGVVSSGRDGVPNVKINKIFSLLAEGPKGGIVFAADIGFSGYHDTITEKRESFGIPATIDGYLNRPQFQFMCAVLGFDRIETKSGLYIEPNKLKTLPVLKK